MRLKTILLAALGLALVVIVGAVLAIHSLDFTKYKSLVAEQVKAATGRDLRIGGNLDLKIGLSPAVVVEDVSFANAPWGSRSEMVKVRRFEVEVALLPLILRDIRVKRLVLVQPDILLETDAKGFGNWNLGGTVPSSPPTAKAGETRAGLTALAVEKVRIERGLLTFRDGKTRRATSFALDRLDLQTKDATGSLALDLAAVYDGKAFTLEGAVGRLQELLAPSRPYPVKLTLKTGGVSLEVDGTIAKPMEAAGLDLKVRAGGQELSEVARLAGKKIPTLGPFTLKAQATGSSDALSISGIDASVGKAEQVLVKASGAVKEALSAKGISMGLTIESKDPRSAAKLFGVDVPAVPPISAAARVADAGGGVCLRRSEGQDRRE